MALTDSDQAAVAAGAKQLGPTSTWDATPRQLAAGYNPDSKGQWGGGAIHAAAVELKQKLPSRSIYRTSDAPIDTVAGYVLNVDAMVHAQDVEHRAIVLGDPDAIADVKRVAAAGNSRAKLALNKIEGR